MLKSPTPNNLTHQLVRELGMAIVQGQFGCEDSFPSEAIICEQYQLSRTATREAIKMLAAKGMLRSRPRTGIMVQQREFWNLFDPDLLQWMLASPPNLEVLRYFMQMRLAIEPEAVALASRIGTDYDISRIQRHLETPFTTNKEERKQALEQELGFYAAIFTATRNPFILQLRNFIETTIRLKETYPDCFSKDEELFQHCFSLYVAIVQRNEEQARQLSYQQNAATIQKIEILLRAQTGH